MKSPDAGQPLAEVMDRAQGNPAIVDVVDVHQVVILGADFGQAQAGTEVAPVTNEWGERQGNQPALARDAKTAHAGRVSRRPHGHEHPRLNVEFGQFLE